ncbi:hypothetical protein [Variovorax sp. YR216]|uniref:hypothetical protein n=1 Tax=Variovorax sp. YR216 TaxID=1882828 RepID=UPI00089D6623|nr:hypothetical protein [Variovorax sp. YR216]SEB24790.1 hypothetical protein SAMN05444680_1221 [Variovorax sp. YR216]
MYEVHAPVLVRPSGRRWSAALVGERRKVQDREIRCLRVLCEPRQGYPDESVMVGPVLYDVRIGDVMLSADGLELIGFEVVDGAIHLQEWDVFLL